MEQKQRQDTQLNAAMRDITVFRAELADFLNRVQEWPDDLIAHCDANGWDSKIAYDLKDGLYKIGTVISCLYRWEHEVDVKNPFAGGGLV